MIKINIGENKDVIDAKNIAHSIRIKKINEKFKPYDEIFKLRIPNNEVKEKMAESERIKIRKKNNEIKEKINKANNIDEIYKTIEDL